MDTSSDGAPTKKRKIGSVESTSEHRKRTKISNAASRAKDAESSAIDISFDDEDVYGGSNTETISRPYASPINGTQTLVFQKSEIESATMKTDREMMPFADNPYSPIIRLYGVDDTGHSYMCRIHGLHPFFYVRAPPGFTESTIPGFLSELNKTVVPELSTYNVEKATKPVIGVEIMQKKSFMGYIKDTSPFLRITVSIHAVIGTVSRTLRDGFACSEIANGATLPYELFESNIEYNLRSMVEMGMVGMGWVEIPRGKYNLHREERRESFCQYELDVMWKDVVCHKPERQDVPPPLKRDWMRNAPFRILSFDIEVAGRVGIFPEAEHDPVIQIANAVQYLGQEVPFVKVVFVLDTCADIPGVDVRSFKTEEELLMAWSKFFRQVDPDFYTGYNTAGFDMEYLLDRAEHLGLAKFAYLGRMRRWKTEIKSKTMSSKAYGTRENRLATANGRIDFDILRVMRRDYKLRKYTLNAVSAHFLGEQKEDVSYKIITSLHNKDEYTRRRLAVYCMKDAILPLRLMNKLMIMINYIEMARVTGVPFPYLLNRGQQIRGLSKMMREIKPLVYVIPVYESKEQGGDVMYEGATVLKPIKGYYETPVATLDFSSLYPSIMIAHNLCYTTLVDKHSGPVGEDCDSTPNGDAFVKPSLCEGILPKILKGLLGARAIAKRDMKAEKDRFKKAVHNGRQLALKVVANSIYGFTGATTGRLPCLAISAGVTSYGRDMIELTRKLVMEKYNRANGYEHDSLVIYGDTDSVMIRFGETDMTKVMEMSVEAAKYVTSHFIKPINLEFEKVYWPYLLVTKKRYAGVYWTKPEKFDKLDVKGMVSVRRDNCLMTSNLIKTCLDKLLIDRDVPGAIQHAKNTLSDLLCGRIDMSQLVITKQLSTYTPKANLPHVEVAKKRKRRDPGSAPMVGDRVPYVLVKGTKKQAQYERVEDPMYVLENDVPIDADTYIKNQLTNPILSIFGPVMTRKGVDGDKEAMREILQGDHMLKIVKSSSTKKGGLAAFMKKQERCVGCKALVKGTQAMCASCEPDAKVLDGGGKVKGGSEEEVLEAFTKYQAEMAKARKVSAVYQKEIAELAVYEREHARLWSQCQRCQGSSTAEVICDNCDCPIFYRRTTAGIKAEKQRKKVDRFNLEW